MKYLKRSLYIDTLSLSGKLTCTLFFSYYRTKISVVKHWVSSKFCATVQYVALSPERSAQNSKYFIISRSGKW